MTSRAMTVPDTPDVRVAEALGALAHDVRVALLRELRTPKALREVEIRVREADGRERPLARQTVKEHLDRLVEAGAVLARDAERAYGPTVEYVVNHQALYALSEELLSLARLRPLAEIENATVAQDAARSGDPAEGPRLVLVKGVDEGRTFDLRPGARTSWVLGRRRGADIPLDHDPFVSSDNARVVWDGSRYLVEDLPDSRNGTRLNFAPLAKGTRHPLASGDVIGVGRTLLVFRS